MLEEYQGIPHISSASDLALDHGHHAEHALRRLFAAFSYELMGHYFESDIEIQKAGDWIGAYQMLEEATNLMMREWTTQDQRRRANLRRELHHRRHMRRLAYNRRQRAKMIEYEEYKKRFDE